VPNHYYRDLYLKLQGLNQGYKSVDEYYEYLVGLDSNDSS
jgi:hypothetical protein